MNSECASSASFTQWGQPTAWVSLKQSNRLR